MPLYQAAEVKISSGIDIEVTETIQKVQNVSVNYSVPRTDVNVIGRTKPLFARPVINYTPVSYSIDYIKNSNSVENSLGILNTSGVGISIGNHNTVASSGYGVRNLELLLINQANDTYANQMTIYSGSLLNFSVSASVGDLARCSLAGEALGYKYLQNNQQIIPQNDVSDIVKPESVMISGIDFSGFGVSGLNIQSFNINLSISRQNIFRFGQRTPQKPITSIMANISINGFIEGLTINESGADIYNCGFPDTGTYYLSLIPTCTSTPGTTYKIMNPYIDSFSLGASVGNFIAVDLGFSVPIPFAPNDLITGSNLIIS